MTETLQLKYLLNKYAKDTENLSVIDVVRLNEPTMLNRYTRFADIYDAQTRDGLSSSADNSLIISAVTTAALREQLIWSGGSGYGTFEKARFKESASGQAYGWGSRVFTQDTWGVASDNHMSMYGNNILFEQQFDVPKNMENFTSVASMFLPTLMARTEDGGLYDVLSDYASKSLFTYNPISQPVYMKKRTVATFIGTDKNGEYRVAWQDVSDHAMASNEKVANSAKITGGISNTYLSEYYTPTIVYDTNAFTTSNSPKLNRSDKTVSEAQYTLTLNLSGMDSVRGNDTYKFTRKSELVNVLKYAKGFWHNTDMIGLANYYLPFAMYLNQIDYAKVQNLNVAKDKSFSQSAGISDLFTAKDTDPIKLVGVSDNTGKLAGVKLGLDASALVADSSIQVVKPNSSTVNDISEAGVSRIKVNKSWVENIVENKIVEGPRLEYPIGGFVIEYDKSKLYQTNLVVYRSKLADKFNWTSEQQVREPGRTRFDLLSTLSIKDSLFAVQSLVQAVWPDTAVTYVEDKNTEDPEPSNGTTGESSGESTGGSTNNGAQAPALGGTALGTAQETTQAFTGTTALETLTGATTQTTTTDTGNKFSVVSTSAKWNLASSKTVLIGGMRLKDLYQGNEKLFSTADISNLTGSLISKAEGAMKNIAKAVDFNLSNTIKVNKGLVSVYQEASKTYMPNWGLSRYKTIASKFGKVASVMYNHNTVAITTENAQIKALEKEPVSVALISNRPQVITSAVQAYSLSTNTKNSNKRYNFINSDSSRKQGVETAAFGKVTLRTGQTGIGYVGKILNEDTHKWEYLTEEIHNGASIELDKQNINIDTISNYDYLITDPQLIKAQASAVIPRSSSKQNGAVYIKTSGFTSEIYDKYAESASAAIRFSSSAARLCEVRNNEQTSLGIHNSNLGQIKQTTFERIQLSTTENLSKENSTVLENKINITAGGYRYKPANTSTNVPDRIIYKSCSLELTQDDVFVTIGKTVYSMANLFKVLKTHLGTAFDSVIVSDSKNIMTGNRPLSGFEGVTGMDSGIAVPVNSGAVTGATASEKPKSYETEIIWLSTDIGNTDDVAEKLKLSSNLLDSSKFEPKIDKNRISTLGTKFNYTYPLAEGTGVVVWTTEQPRYPYDKSATKYRVPALRTISLERNSKGILTVSAVTPFKLGTAYTGYESQEIGGNNFAIGETGGIPIDFTGVPTKYPNTKPIDK